MTAPLAQALLLSQLWPTLQQTVGSMAQTGGPVGTAAAGVAAARCPCCHGSVSRGGLPPTAASRCTNQEKTEPIEEDYDN